MRQAIFRMPASVPAEVENPKPSILPSGHAVLARIRSSFRFRLLNILSTAHKPKRTEKNRQFGFIFPTAFFDFFIFIIYKS